MLKSTPQMYVPVVRPVDRCLRVSRVRQLMPKHNIAGGRRPAAASCQVSRRVQNLQLSSADHRQPPDPIMAICA